MLQLKSEYLVQIHGSSLIGDIFGQGEFLDAYRLLETLREKGQFQCFQWWCPSCQDSSPKNYDDLVSHVFLVSSASIRRFLQGKGVEWRWGNPGGQWAIQSGDPTKFAQRLLRSKSRPKWKIIISLVVYEVEGRC